MVHISRVEDDVDVSTLDKYYYKSKRFPKPLGILYQKESVKPVVNWMSPILVCVPSPFPYESIKAISRNHDVLDHVSGSKENMDDKFTKALDLNITNILGASGITRSS